jgi:hypothetical protein
MDPEYCTDLEFPPNGEANVEFVVLCSKNDMVPLPEGVDRVSLPAVMTAIHPKTNTVMSLCAINVDVTTMKFATIRDDSGKYTEVRNPGGLTAQEKMELFIHMRNKWHVNLICRVRYNSEASPGSIDEFIVLSCTMVAPLDLYRDAIY